MLCALETLQTSKALLSHVLASCTVEQNTETQICDTPGDFCSPTGREERIALLHWWGFFVCDKCIDMTFPVIIHFP